MPVQRSDDGQALSYQRDGHPGTGVRRLLPIANLRTPGRFLYGTVLLGLLMLPVNYHGGAEVAHPHAIVQLLIDAAHGSTDHHRRWGHHDGTSHQTLPAKPRPETTVASSSLDAPRLTEVTPAHERPLLVPALAVLGLFLLLTQAAPIWGVAVSLVGRRPRPDVPPPRVTASC